MFSIQFLLLLAPHWPPNLSQWSRALDSASDRFWAGSGLEDLLLNTTVELNCFIDVKHMSTSQAYCCKIELLAENTTKILLEALASTFATNIQNEQL